MFVPYLGAVRVETVILVLFEVLEDSEITKTVNHVGILGERNASV